MKKQVLLLILILLSMTAKADIVEIDGIYYWLNSVFQDAGVGYSPNIEDQAKYKGEVIIPATVAYKGVEYRISYIAPYAFNQCSELTSVIIPNSVKSIGEHAFQACRGLTSLIIPNSVTSIEDYAFWGCSGLTSLIIPNSVTSIGECAFRDCSGLTSLIIPNSVTSIGVCALGNCSGMTSIKVENDNTIYDSRDNCNSIIETQTNTLMTGCKNTTIPNNVTSIGDYAFYGCNGLTSVTIPYSVTSIGEEAFEGCFGLTDVYCYASPDALPWNAYNKGFKPYRETLCHVEANKIETFKSKFVYANVIFVGDLEPDAIENLTTVIACDNLWYTLDGRKLEGEPTEKGVYIKDGKKYIIQ